MRGVGFFAAAAGALLLLPLGGCVSSILAKQVVAPPNKSGIKPLFADWDVIKHAPDAFTSTWDVKAPGPPANIAVASIEPRDYQFHYVANLSYPEGKPPNIDKFEAYWRPATEAAPLGKAPRGTIVLLHGYLQNKNYSTPWAVRLAQAGFRCVVVDLRGHGQSTGAHIGFGAFEAADISAVIDDLGRRGWDVTRVGLLGVSYGASVSLLTAGRDPRVAAVVAFEPFSSAEVAVPELMRATFASKAKGISDRQFSSAHVKEARIGGFDWTAADIPAALARTRAPVLFFHGEADHWLSPAHSRRLFEVAPAGSQLVLVPNDNHVTLPLQIAPFETRVIEWFDAGFQKR